MRRASRLARAPRPAPDGVAVLVVPGLHGSGPRHWQSIWEARREDTWRVEQADWYRPRLGDWAATLDQAVRARSRVVLVAHSLGCALVAQWARCGCVDRVAAALLVAPADVDAPGLSDELVSFTPMPLERLPFPAWVVASTDDPFVSAGRAREFAIAWGARFLDAGASGHINVESGHGSWPDGERLLDQLVEGARDRIEHP